MRQKYGAQRTNGELYEVRSWQRNFIRAFVSDSNQSGFEVFESARWASRDCNRKITCASLRDASLPTRIPKRGGEQGHALHRPPE